MKLGRSCTAAAIVIQMKWHEILSFLLHFSFIKKGPLLKRQQQKNLVPFMNKSSWKKKSCFADVVKMLRRCCCLLLVLLLYQGQALIMTYILIYVF